MHDRRESVIRGLGTVDVVVWVYGLLAAQLAADRLDRAVGDDLVDVHVRLRARSGLPDVDRALAVQGAGEHLVGDLADEGRLPGRKAALARVDDRAGLLHVAVGVVDGGG